MVNRRIVSFLLLAVVAAACGSDGETSSTSLPGSAWRLAAVADEVDAVSGSGASLEFRDDGTAGGTTGCNAFNTSYEIDGDALSFGPIMATLAACVDEALSTQESAFLAALDATAGFSIEDHTLRLQNSNGDVVAVLDEFDGQVAGTAWEVLSVNNGQEAVVSVIQGTELTVTFDDDGGVSGSAGCNSFSGSYDVSGNDIAIGPLSSTRKACASPDGVMEQEQRFLAALEGASTVAFVGERLELRTDTGALAVSLRAQA